MMNNKLYDTLKWLVMIVFPATATLYTTLSGIWGLPFADEIPASITAIATFLGVVLMISSAQYKKNQ